MAEALQILLRQTLPEELSSLLADRLTEIENGNFLSLLQSPEAKILFGHQNSTDLENVNLENSTSWSDFIFERLGKILTDRSDTTDESSPAYKQHLYFLLGYAALLAFLQSNVTGPQLPFSSAKTLFPLEVANDAQQVTALRRTLIASVGLDGIAAYKLTPNIELLCLADAIITNPAIVKNVAVARWAKLRVSYIHQRLLSEPSSTLQNGIYADLDAVEELFFANGETKQSAGDNARVQFLLERSTIETFHGLDKKAREDLDQATTAQGFQFALTGLLGRRTKFQQHDISQLVVLAKSAEDGGLSTTSNGKEPISQTDSAATGPQNLDLNDDTLLESISFTDKPASSTDVRDVASLPPALAELDPANQPLLKPLDSIILLALASSITNTSPNNGLTREETVPYATRVLEGGSSNWQVYTQALLVRSRIEGYKSRTIERGLLQLQAVVDQVIADTAETPEGADSDGGEAATSFLPKAQGSESAPASQRLKYIFQLSSPTRWELEAELAQRWVQLGGLRSALEIYERLEMWPEAALCYAATEKEDMAKKIARRQLYHTTNGGPDKDESTVEDDERWEGPERVPPPADAARLYCIIGDIDSDPAMYEKAWEVSNHRYARAQRSLGRFHFAAKDHVNAADSYAKSLKVNQLNHTSWFALGCSLLELSQYERAVEAFSRCVQLEEADAESWSNLAAALLKNEVPAAVQLVEEVPEPAADEEAGEVPQKKADPQKNRKDALKALKRAAALKYDSYRIWENLLVIAASVSPPDYTAILSAQRHLIDIRGQTVGEKCIDVEIMGHLVRHVISTSEGYDPNQPGYERILVEVFDKQITPLITASRPLWQMVGKLALWRNKPSTALEANEKAWRAVTTQPGWETESEKRWNEVVESTVELSDAYESLGPREKSEGLGAGGGALVAKDWKFKARSAIRGIMGRGRDSWEGTEGWERLKDALEQLKN